MKKIIFLLAIVWGGYLYAQDNGVFDNDNNTEKAREEFEAGPSSSAVYGAGDVSLEVGFMPQGIFNSSTSGDLFGLIGNQIRFRSFNAKGNAMRMGIGLQYFRSAMVYQPASGSDPALHEYNTLWSVSILPGYEKHYRVSRVFSPYWGFQVLFGYQGSSYSVEHLSGGDVYKETWSNDPTVSGIGSLNLGSGLVFGFDYFPIKHLYVGLELGFGFEYAHLLDSEYTNEDDHSLDETSENGSLFIVSPYMTNGFVRLGWLF